MEKKQKKQHARSRSFTGSGLASFFRSTFSSTVPSTGGGGGRWSSFNHRNAFSGPIAVSIVPPEARGRSGGGRRSNNKRSSGYATPEPSSPKVSCIGQIKRSNSRRQKKVNPSASTCVGGACPLPPRPAEGKKPSRLPSKKGGSLLKRVSFFRRSRSRSLSRASSSTSKEGLVGDGKAMAAAGPAPAAPPAGLGLGQMRRFTSGRAAFQDFDWREEERRSRGSDEEDDYDDGFVAHSAPLVLGGGVVASEPRKEVNLWRRRPTLLPLRLSFPRLG